MSRFAQIQHQSQKDTSTNPVNSWKEIFEPDRKVNNRALLSFEQGKPYITNANRNIKSATPIAHNFGQIPIYAKSKVKLQPKLTINKPGDAYEQEADNVANRVMHMHEPKLQRACACGGTFPKCKEEKSEHEQKQLQQRHTGSNNFKQVEAPGLVHEALQSAGHPLEPSTRAFMEPRFGHNFSQVRVHTDTKAAESAASINALAYTVGQNVVFGAKQYAPQTTAGKSLLAHELAHVVQQRSTIDRKIQRREVCDDEGICHSEPDEEMNYTPNVAVVAGASLMPPGDCTYAEHRTLQDEVDRACDRNTRCTQNDSCPTIWERIQFNAECIRARSTINTRCFRGGDPGHTEALANAVAALGNCWAVYNRRCQPQIPPVRVPVTQERRRPVVDKSFMDRMAEITGLTGTALVLYLIVSEGSRLFPPRNLVPVP